MKIRIAGDGTSINIVSSSDEIQLSAPVFPNLNTSDRARSSSVVGPSCEFQDVSQHP